jgi:hypothetical protein
VYCHRIIVSWAMASKGAWMRRRAFLSGKGNDTVVGQDTSAISVGAIMAWAGVIGGAISLLSNLEGLLRLIDWIRYLTYLWTTFSHWAFSWLAGLFNIKIAQPTSVYLSFLSTIFLAAVGSYMGDSDRRAFIGEFALRIGIYALILAAAGTAIGLIALININQMTALYIVVGPLAAFAVTLISMGPFVVLVLRSVQGQNVNYLTNAADASIIFAILFSFFMLFNIQLADLERLRAVFSKPDSEYDFLNVAKAYFQTPEGRYAGILIFATSFAPFLFINARTYLRRLQGMIILLAAIIVLNEIGKSDLSQYLYAPKVPS